MVKTTQLFYLVFVSNLLIACASYKSVDDDRNENLSKKKIMNSYPSDLLEANINISSFNGDLLITGQVPRQELVRLADTPRLVAIVRSASEVTRTIH